MVTYAAHLGRILRQVLESHATLADIKGTPLDIDRIRREVLRKNGSLRAVLSNIPDSSSRLLDFELLRPKLAKYMDEYDFEGELDTMDALYSEDVMRINNIRIKILEALRDRKMIESVRELVDEL